MGDHILTIHAPRSAQVATLATCSTTIYGHSDPTNFKEGKGIVLYCLIAVNKRVAIVSF